MAGNTFFHILNHALQTCDYSHKFVEMESKEDILDVFSGFDKELIFNILILFFLGRAFLEEIEIINRGLSICLSNLKGFKFLCEISFDLIEFVEETFSLSLRDFLTDFFAVFTLEINTKLFEVFLEILLRWIANSLGLFDEVIFNFTFTVHVILIGFFVHNWLISSLIVKSFSHMLVLFKSNCLCNES